MSTIKADTLSNLAGTQSVPVATVAQGSAKAWVRINGTGTVAILAAFNVSSITDGGVGAYTLNFTNALADTSFVTTGTLEANGVLTSNRIAGRTTTSETVYCINLSGAAIDVSLDVAIFR